jgi:Family of unknown function (DUF5335)
MTIAHDLPRERWQAYLEDISAARFNAPTLLEVAEPDGPDVREERGLLLRSVSYDPHDDEFAVTVAAPSPSGEQLLRHVVAEPVRILSDSANGIIPAALAIEPPAGGRTVVRILLVPEMTG